MNRSRAVTLAAVATLAIGAWCAFAQTSARTGAAPPVATVGPQRIERDEFEHRAEQAVQQLGSRQGTALPADVRDLLRRQMLESLIRLDLLVLEAKRQGIQVPMSEAEAQLKQDPFFNPGGKFDAGRFAAVRTTQPAQFQAALARLSDQLAARKLNDQLEAKFAPDEAGLRRRAVRQLRRATLDQLQLRRGEFIGTYPEPRESQVLAFYAAHAEEWRRPARAQLSVVFVNEPALAESLQRNAGEVAAWNRRMKATADSLLAAVRAGTPLEQATSYLGGPRPNVQVTPDNFPGYWHGSETVTASVFRQAPGTILPEAVPSAEGWLIVRVDAVTQAGRAPLAEVSREIRQRLRTDARVHHEEQEERALYATLRDSLAGPAWRIRYAIADTALVRVPEPTDAELERWYRGHLADYSSYDTRSGSIVAKPLAEVREDARSRWKHERQMDAAREAAEAVESAWRGGRRDAAAESRLIVRESAPLPRDADVDTGFAAHALSDSLWAHGEPGGAVLVAWPRGYFVWQATGRVDRMVPTFEQAHVALQNALQARRDAEDERAAHALFDRDRAAFSHGNILHFSRVMLPAPDAMTIRLTRAEVERWHRDHIDRYSAPELVRVRHILISPHGSSPAADQAARQLADSLLARVKAGDDFGELAKKFSEDPATASQGGDLGVFGRGTMLDAFEKAAFAMQPGDLSGPVKTEVGYHILQCLEHTPAFEQQLELVYTNVASDAAQAKADTIGARRADSLARTLHTPAQARAAAAKFGLRVEHLTFRVGDPSPAPSLQAYFDALNRAKPGDVFPEPWRLRNEGWWITWVDSITPPTVPTWDEARERALSAYRSNAGGRALEAKRLELDSLFTAGWSLDSVAALWGGLERTRELTAVRGPDGRGGSTPLLDSLVFGSPTSAPALSPGETSGWVSVPGGLARMRLESRVDAPNDRLLARVEELRKIAIEHKMEDYFDGLRRRYPVRILDAKLREMQLPRPPDISD